MDNHKRQDEEVLLTGMLAEFREALRDEIKKIERAGKTCYFLSYIIVSSLYLIALIVVFILFKTDVIL